MTTATGAGCGRTGAYAFGRAIKPGEAGPEPSTVIGPRSDPTQSVRDLRSVPTGRRGGLTASRRHGVESCLPSKPAPPPSATHRRGPRRGSGGPCASKGCWGSIFRGHPSATSQRHVWPRSAHRVSDRRLLNVDESARGGGALGYPTLAGKSPPPPPELSPNRLAAAPI